MTNLFANALNLKLMNARILKIGLLIVLFSLGTNCTKKIYIFQSNPNKYHAPGQVKKRTGSKSAKPYAPGQNKKKDNNNNQLYLQVIKKNQALISKVSFKDSDCLPL